jgi:Transglycosylase SLT domain
VIRAAATAAAIVTAFPLLVIVLVAASPDAAVQATGSADLPGEPITVGTAGIPADYLTLYVGAAKTCPGLPWPVLAGIGKVESDHGQSTLPGVHTGANSAGAEGPMQFLPGTFAEFAVNADPGQPLSPYDPADAIYTAARMLCADGARGGSAAGIERAIFAYNHADWYVTEVLSWARKYAAQDGSGLGVTHPAKPISAQEASL